MNRDDQISRILEKFSRLSPDQQEKLLEHSVFFEIRAGLQQAIAYEKGELPAKVRVLSR